MQAAHEFLLEAARRLSARGTKVFTVAEIMREARSLGATQKDSTPRTMTTAHLCANAPDNSATTCDYFEQVGHDRYRLADDSR